MQVSKQKCIILDSYGFIFRAYHVQPKLLSPNGIPVGAIYGFTSMLIKLLSDFNPASAIAVFDTGSKNFRHEIYPAYKANRPDVSEDLIAQFPLARDVVTKFNLKSLEINGYEADDVIASLAINLASNDNEVIIVSSDKDLAQLMGENIKIYDPSKARIITNDDIIAKYGVNSDKIRDVLALIGDSSDNIPGVAGFGPKTAAELINQFGSFDNLLSNIENISSERKRNLLLSNLENAKLSWELIGLKDDIPIDLNLSLVKWEKPLHSQLLEFVKNYGFKSLENRISKVSSESFSQASLMPIIQSKNEEFVFKSTINIGDLKDFISKILDNGYVNIFVEKEYIFLSSNENDIQVPLENLIEYFENLNEIFQSKFIHKFIYNYKSITKLGFKLESAFDVMLANYVLSAGLPQKNLYELNKELLGLDISSSALLACRSLKTLHDQLTLELVKIKSLSLYLDLDLKLSYLLTKIENDGVKFDVEYLNQLSSEFAIEANSLEQKIFEISGCSFNIASPKQLGEILFEKMGLKSNKTNTKSKTYSTSVDILEELSESGVEIADYLIKWRQLTKLKNTYTDSLPNLVDKKTNRIHTTLLQTSTSTGRLSSTDPNLQNIPIRTQEGSRIRNAIIVEKGNKLISADYSQIELRILSQIANIKSLQEAYINGLDIHSGTASQIFKIPYKDVTAALRRKAKAINFGIIYGISSFGLAKQLGISRNEAKTYIENYFLEYPGIKEYMDNCIKFARENGYITNFFGRRIYLPTINDSNHALKNFGERAAINAPIQGTAADIAKIAMINIDKALTKQNYKTKMILQIHDELLFEAPEIEVDNVMKVIKKEMENVVKFKVPLDVAINCGLNWSEVH